MLWAVCFAKYRSSFFALFLHFLFIFLLWFPLLSNWPMSALILVFFQKALRSLSVHFWAPSAHLHRVPVCCYEPSGNLEEIRQGVWEGFDEAILEAVPVTQRHWVFCFSFFLFQVLISRHLITLFLSVLCYITREWASTFVRCALTPGSSSLASSI